MVRAFIASCAVLFALTSCSGTDEADKQQLEQAKQVLRQKILAATGVLAGEEYTLKYHKDSAEGTEALSTATGVSTQHDSELGRELESEVKSRRARLDSLKEQLEYVETWGKMPPESMLTN